MRTTVDISDVLLRDLRKKAAQSKRPFKVVLEEAIQYGLSVSKDRPAPSKICIKTYPVGIKAAYRGMSMNQLYDQLESENTLTSQ